MSQSLFYATLTPKGRGAIAVISVSGPKIATVIDACFAPAAKKKIDAIDHDIIYGIWNSTGEDLLLIRSAVDQYEIQCHGSQAVVDAITADLEARGVSAMSPSSDRGNTGLTFQSEIELLLNQAKTERAALLLLNQWHLFPVAAEKLAVTGIAQRQQTINTMLEWASFGLNFHRVRSVVFCGRPNAGKSSLINRVLGFHRAIVNPMPGTTRDVVSEGSAVDGWPVEFSDTAGIRQAAGEIEKIGIEKAQQTIDLADVVIGVVDAVEPGDPIDRSPDIVVVNKSDLVDSAKIDLIVENVNARFAKAVCVTASATTGDGVDLLLDAIAKVLCPEVPPAGQAFPVTQSQVDWLKAEQIR